MGGFNLVKENRDFKQRERLRHSSSQELSEVREGS